MFNWNSKEDLKTFKNASGIGKSKAQLFCCFESKITTIELIYNRNINYGKNFSSSGHNWSNYHRILKLKQTWKKKFFGKEQENIFLLSLSLPFEQKPIQSIKNAATHLVFVGMSGREDVGREGGRVRLRVCGAKNGRRKRGQAPHSTTLAYLTHLLPSSL